MTNGTQTPLVFYFFLLPMVARFEITIIQSFSHVIGQNNSYAYFIFLLPPLVQGLELTAIQSLELVANKLPLTHHETAPTKPP